MNSRTVRETTRQSPTDTIQVWHLFHSRYELSDNDIISISRFDRYRRVYRSGDRILKVVIPHMEESSHLRVNTMSDEYSLLCSCQHLATVPKILRHYVDPPFEVTELERISGSTFDQTSLPIREALVAFGRITKAIAQLAKLGISHNDLVPGNILIGEFGNIVIIDFDQATIHVPYIAFIRTIFGIPIGGIPVHRSALGLTFRTILSKLSRIFPSKIKDAAKKLLNISGEATLPVIPESASNAAKSLYNAWAIAQHSKASAPGQTLAYYAFDFEGFRFPGERPWEIRWDYLRKASDYEDKRVLELGCNMALLSCHLLKYEGAQAAMAADIDAEILRSAQIVAESLGVNPTFLNVNLDSTPNWELEFNSFQPDIVFALNVLNWVRDKDRLLNYLSGVPELVFEGHDSVSVESQRLRNLGFDQVQLITTTERQRPVFHCMRSS